MYTKDVNFALASGSSSLMGTEADVVVLFADLRGFSTWSKSASLKDVGEVIKVQYECVIQICNDHHHCFHKFLGDGFLLLWEIDRDIDLTLCLQRALDAAFHIHKKYWFFAKDAGIKVPDGYGLGISIGRAIRIQPETFIKEMNEIDFLGYTLNCAARMQALSNPPRQNTCRLDRIYDAGGHRGTTWHDTDKHSKTEW